MEIRDMNKYEKGQIYKIVSPDFSKCYIGSTTEGLSRRLARHKASYHYIRKNNKSKNCSSFMLFDEYGIDNCKIYWVEDYPSSALERTFASREVIPLESGWAASPPRMLKPIDALYCTTIKAAGKNWQLALLL